MNEIATQDNNPRYRTLASTNVTLNGVERTVYEWAVLRDIKLSTVASRRKRGLNWEESLSKSKLGNAIRKMNMSHLKAKGGDVKRKAPTRPRFEDTPIDLEIEGVIMTKRISDWASRFNTTPIEIYQRRMRGLSWSAAIKGE